MGPTRLVGPTLVNCCRPQAVRRALRDAHGSGGRGDGEDIRRPVAGVGEGLDDGGTHRLLGVHRGQRNGRAAEPAPGHAGADGTMGPGRVHGQVQPWAGDFKVVAHGSVAGIEQGADGAWPGAAQELYGLEHPVIFGNHMAHPPERDLIEQTAGLLKVSHLDVPQRLDPQHLRSQLTGGRREA